MPKLFLHRPEPEHGNRKPHLIDRFVILNRPDNLDESLLLMVEGVRLESSGDMHKNRYFCYNFLLMDEWSVNVTDEVLRQGTEPVLDYVVRDHDRRNAGEKTGDTRIRATELGSLMSLPQDSLLSSEPYYHEACVLDVGLFAPDIFLDASSLIHMIVEAVNEIFQNHPVLHHFQLPETVSDLSRHIMERYVPVMAHGRMKLVAVESLREKATDILRPMYVTGMESGIPVLRWYCESDIPFGFIYGSHDDEPEFSIRCDHPVNIERLQPRFGPAHDKADAAFRLHLRGPVEMTPDMRGVSSHYMSTLTLEDTLLEPDVIIGMTSLSGERSVDGNGSRIPELIEIIEDEEDMQARLVAASLAPLSCYVGYHGYRYGWEHFVQVINGDEPPIDVDDYYMNGSVRES